MASIHELIQEAIAAGDLDPETEAQLRKIVKSWSDDEDMQAFVNLQPAEPFCQRFPDFEEQNRCEQTIQTNFDRAYQITAAIAAAALIALSTSGKLETADLAEGVGTTALPSNIHK
ncbi:MAG: hypothetical protein ACFB4I_13230 [Cyanophyceae cyanobacterium]